MRRNKLLIISLTAILLVSSSLKVSAAGVKDVFDASYYAGRYSDLKSAYGTDEAALFNHFMTRGAYEGRVMSPILDVVAYRAAYADLNAAFGDDWNAYVNHYLTYGIAEKRTSGVLFDLAAYAESYPDVKAAYGEDYTAIARHYIIYGMKEGRSSSGLLKQAVTAVSLSLESSGTTESVSGGSNSTGGVSGESGSAGAASDPSGSAANTPGMNGPVNGTPGGNNSTDGILGEGASGEAGQAPAEHVHSWELTDSRAASCTEDGYRDYRCQGMMEIRNGDGCVIAIIHCTETKRETIKAAHTRPEAVQYVTYEDCTRTGLIRYNCTVCGKEQQEEVPALGHDYDINKDQPLRSQASTCREAGYDIYLCRRCGAEVREARPLTAHAVKEWTVEREASCSAEGLKTGWCTVCSRQVTESIPGINHVNAENINVYADAYEEATSVRHSVQNITYCRDCGYIIAAGVPSYVNCADAGNGVCGTCGLPVTREAIAEPKVYRAGGYYQSGAE